MEIRGKVQEYVNQRIIALRVQNAEKALTDPFSYQNLGVMQVFIR